MIDRDAAERPKWALRTGACPHAADVNTAPTVSAASAARVFGQTAATITQI
jgi:hypothetical protein